jgi:hypothetical protein
MRFADLAVQRMLNALDESGGAGVGATHGSLHSAYSSSGANELTGGSPAYARKAATWAAASGRSKATSASMVFDVPAGQTVRWVGFWDAVSAGNFLGMVPNGGGTPEAFVVDDATADVTTTRWSSGLCPAWRCPAAWPRGRSTTSSMRRPTIFSFQPRRAAPRWRLARWERVSSRRSWRSRSALKAPIRCHPRP